MKVFLGQRQGKNKDYNKDDKWQFLWSPDAKVICPGSQKILSKFGPELAYQKDETLLWKLLCSHNLGNTGKKSYLTSGPECMFISVLIKTATDLLRNILCLSRTYNNSTICERYRWDEIFSEGPSLFLSICVFPTRISLFTNSSLQ